MWYRSNGYKEIDTAQNIRSVRALDREILHCMQRSMAHSEHRPIKPEFTFKTSQEAEPRYPVHLMKARKAPVTEGTHPLAPSKPGQLQTNLPAEKCIFALFD